MYYHVMYSIQVWNFESGKQVMFSDSPGQVFCSALFPDKQDFLLTISPSESLAEKGRYVQLHCGQLKK